MPPRIQRQLLRQLPSPCRPARNRPGGTTLSPASSLPHVVPEPPSSRAPVMPRPSQRLIHSLCPVTTSLPHSLRVRRDRSCESPSFSAPIHRCCGPHHSFSSFSTTISRQRNGRL